MENNSHKKRRGSKWVLVLIGIICIVVAFVLLILFLLQGNTTTISEGGSTETTESIVCESTKVSYPFFKHENTDQKSVKINAIFNDGKLDTITLTYQLEYEDAEIAKQRSAENHADLNKSFSENSLGADSLKTHFSTLKNVVQLSLYAESKDVTGITSKYFLLDNISGNHKKDIITKLLNDKGLDCITSQ